MYEGLYKFICILKLISHAVLCFIILSRQRVGSNQMVCLLSYIKKVFFLLKNSLKIARRLEYFSQYLNVATVSGC